MPIIQIYFSFCRFSSACFVRVNNNNLSNKRTKYTKKYNNLHSFKCGSKLGYSNTINIRKKNQKKKFQSLSFSRIHCTLNKMPMKDILYRLQPFQLYIILCLSIAFFLVQLFLSHISHALTLLVQSYHMLCNIMCLVGCILTLKVSLTG